MNPVNTRNTYCRCLVFIWIALAWGFVVIGCRTTSSYSKDKDRKSHILEPRYNVPQPYQEPTVRSETKVEYSEPPSVAPMNKNSIPEDHTIGWTAIQPPVIETSVIEKKVLPVEIPPIVIDEKIDETKVPEPVYSYDKEPLSEINFGEPDSRLSYTVKKGDTLWDIAGLYGVSVGELAAENNVKKTDILKIGMVLRIPAGGAYRPAPERLTRSHIKTQKKKSKKRRKQPVPASGKYVVKKGDSLWEISQIFGLNLKKLKEINGLTNSDLLHPGQVIILTEPESATSINEPLLSPVVEEPESEGESTSSSGFAEREQEQTDVDVTINIPDTDRETPPEGSSSKPLVSSTIDLKNLPHYISAGDTLESIAEMYGSEIEWILKANPEVKGNSDLAEGMEIQVPCPDIK